MGTYMTYFYIRPSTRYQAKTSIAHIARAKDDGFLVSYCGSLEIEPRKAVVTTEPIIATCGRCVLYAEKGKHASA
jgi:hypothetical protein